MPAWMTSLLRALMPVPKCAFGFEDQHVASRCGQRTGNRKAYDTRTDDYDINLVHRMSIVNSAAASRSASSSQPC
jgi:hypothetical protein